MKNLLILLSILFFNCDGSNYIKTMDLETGQYKVVADREHITNIGDTLVISNTNLSYTSVLYGKYIGTLPKLRTYPNSIKGNDTIYSVIYYSKAIRIK